MKTKHPQFLTTVCTLVALLCTSLYCTTELGKVLSPTQFRIVSNGVREHELSSLSYISLMLAVFFITISSINISLTWILVLHFSKRIGMPFPKPLEYYTRFAKLLEFTWFLNLIVCLCLDLFGSPNLHHLACVDFGLRGLHHLSKQIDNAFIELWGKFFVW